ncbi:MAG: hypothetical protein V4819_16905 [Verrucomicrobiota bacterium]
MKPHEIPIFITAASMSLLAGRAVVADRFKNRITDMGVIVGGVLPWITIGMWQGWLPGSDYFFILGVLGSGPLFFGALLRYWLGPRFDNWERATIAMVAAVLAVVGFWMSIEHWFIRY